MNLRQALVPLVDFAFPPRCPSCGDAVMGGLADVEQSLCALCWGRLLMPGQPACAACQLPLASDALSTDRLCPSCAAEPPLHDGIAAATLYGPVSREIVLALKHSGRIALAGPMGRFMALRFGASGLAELDDPLVVPVPLHRTRLWKRGYNQSVLLGEAFARRREWSFGPDLLRRIRRTPSLDGMGREERRDTLDGAIAAGLDAQAILAGRDVVLIDDVVTSGATTGACVTALKNAGARRVIIACYARVDGSAGRSPTDKNARAERNTGP